MDLLDWFKAQNTPGWNDRSIVFYAGYGGHISAARWCLRNLQEPLNTPPNNWIRYFGVEDLKKIESDCGYDWIAKGISLENIWCAVLDGRVEVLQYVLQKVSVSLSECEEDLISQSTKSLPMVQYLIETCHLPITPQVLIQASASDSGSADVLRYLYKYKDGMYTKDLIAISWFSSTSIKVCEEHGHTPVFSEWCEVEEASKLEYMLERYPEELAKAPADVFSCRPPASIMRRLLAIGLKPPPYMLRMCVRSDSYLALEQVRFLVEEARLRPTPPTLKWFLEEEELRQDVREYLCTLLK